MVNSRDWDAFWAQTTPESEILMRDFYGGRQWILKHVPRFGKVVEAGSGLGRYVFYLEKLGIDVEGVDFHEDTVRRAIDWSRGKGLSAEFKVADVLDLPYEAGTVSGYLSFGVVEHFVGGPQKAIREAHRVLRPGGIAIITTPSVSFSLVYLRILSKIKDAVRRAIGAPRKKQEFFQYWYSPERLAGFVEKSGFRVVLHGGGDLFYPMWELGVIPRGNAFFALLARLERTALSRFGAQSFTVSVKAGPMMHCFLCGQQKVKEERLKKFYVPICEDCESSDLARHYRHARRPKFNEPWSFESGTEPVTSKTCTYCGSEFQTDPLFEDFGFSVPVCEQCLKKPEINIELSNRFLKPTWRNLRPG